MSIILGIETSTKMCSIALSKNNQLIALRELSGEYSHAEHIATFIQQVCEESQINLNTIDFVAVSKGPGSYTGLRIGVSAAKGLCYALNKPLLSVDTLKVMTAEIINEKTMQNHLFCPMIDARRMEVYTAVYSSSLTIIEPITAKIIDEYSFQELLAENQIVFFGDGAHKCKSLLEKNKNAIFIDNIEPSAKYLNQLANEMVNNHTTEKIDENIAYFEPFYLKDFVSTTPKKDS